jgi:hypothetical protein
MSWLETPRLIERFYRLSIDALRISEVMSVNAHFPALLYHLVIHGYELFHPESMIISSYYKIMRRTDKPGDDDL